jgi:hypothetical protein
MRVGPFNFRSSLADDSIMEAVVNVRRDRDNGLFGLWWRFLRVAAVGGSLVSGIIMNIVVSTMAGAATAETGAKLLQASEAATAHEQSVHFG